MVQRCAARFVTGEYRLTSSVSALIKTLGLHSLARRRAMSRETMLYPSHSWSCWHPTRPSYTVESYHERQCLSLHPGPHACHGLQTLLFFQKPCVYGTTVQPANLCGLQQLPIQGWSRDVDPVNNRLFLICTTAQDPRPSQGVNCTRRLFWTKHIKKNSTLRLPQSTHSTTTRLDNTLYTKEWAVSWRSEGFFRSVMQLQGVLSNIVFGLSKYIENYGPRSTPISWKSVWFP